MKHDSVSNSKPQVHHSSLMDDSALPRAKAVNENYGWSVEMLLRFTCWPPRCRCTCIRRWVYGTFLILRTKMSLRHLVSRSQRPCHPLVTLLLAFMFLVAMCSFLNNQLLPLWLNEKSFVEFHYPVSNNRSLHDILHQHEMYGSGALKDFVQPLNDYHTFQYRLVPPRGHRQWQGNHSATILMAVKTTHLKEDRRRLIRQLWGRSSCYEHYGVLVHLVFLLGATPDAGADQRLRVEHEQHGDIVQQDFLDAYYNNTYKFMMALDYAVAHWQSRGAALESDYLLLVDDDYFVNPLALVNYMQHSISPHERPTFVGGTMLFHARPFRSRWSKWRISLRDYPFEYYPDYLAGGFILMSGALARDLRLCSSYVKYFPFDDVFLGFMLYQLRILPRHMAHVYDRRHFSQDFNMADIASHGYSSTRDLIYSWRKLHLSHFCFLK